MGVEEVGQVEALITRSEDIAWGAAVIAGTRVPVDTLFEYLERGRRLDEFLDQFPAVSREKADGILEMAREEVKRRLSGEGAARRDASHRCPRVPDRP